MLLLLGHSILLSTLAVLAQTASTTHIRSDDRAVAAGNVRVLDAGTNSPVAGARVSGVDEAAAPVWGEFWSSSTATTDADGWASLPPPPAATPYGWTIIRADGYAIFGESSVPSASDPLVVELQRAVPAELRVVDVLGRPIPLVHLGFCVGCGHTPDVASAVTDVDGRATLLCVGAGERGIADVYPVGATVRTTYLDIDWDAAIDGGYEAVASPGCIVEGTLLLPDGTPAVDFAVGTNDVHRGPWCRTDSSGRFRLFGVDRSSDADLTVQTPDGKALEVFGGARANVHRMLQLGADPLGGERSGTTGTGTLTLALDAEGDAVARAAVWEKDLIPYSVWDPATGWCETGSVTAGEPVALELRVGTYEVEVGGGASPFARRHLGTIAIGAGPDAPRLAHRLPMIRIERLEVEGVGARTEFDVLSWTGERRSVEFDSVVQNESGASVGVVEAFAVPSEPFGLWLMTEKKGRSRDFVVLDLPLESSGVLRGRVRS